MEANEILGVFLYISKPYFLGTRFLIELDGHYIGRPAYPPSFQDPPVSALVLRFTYIYSMVLQDY